MGEMDLGLVFLVGVIIGAYGAYLAHPIIEMGVGLMKLKQKENRAEKAAELKAKNAQANDATPPAS